MGEYHNRWLGRMTAYEWSEVLNPSGTNFTLDPRIERGNQQARDWLSLEADLLRDARTWKDAWVDAVLSVETGIERRNKELDGMFNELSE